MPLWGNTDNAANSVKYGTELIRTGPAGSGNAAKAANNTALYMNLTPQVFTNSAMSEGQFAVTPAQLGNTDAIEWGYPAHAGWNMRIQGTGPISSKSTAAGGSGFANGESVTVSGATTNAIGILTANATGNLVSVSFNSGGSGFSNNDAGSTAFNREQHLTAITVSGTPVGFSNTDTIVVAGNSTVVALANGSATVSTNSTGGFVSANLTLTGVGLYPNTATTGSLTFTVKAANGGASAGSGATFAGTLGTSTGGTITLAYGGRANRVQYETIVAMSSISSANTQIPG